MALFTLHFNNYNTKILINIDNILRFENIPGANRVHLLNNKVFIITTDLESTIRDAIASTDDLFINLQNDWHKPEDINLDKVSFIEESSDGGTIVAYITGDRIAYRTSLDELINMINNQ
jgi:hypothetical protein